MQTSDIKIECESTAWQTEPKYQDLRAPASRNVYYIVNLVFEQIKGASFQAELLVMTLLGLTNCTLNWRHFDWKSQAEKIGQVPMTSEYSEEIKTVLRWIIITRIIIDHMYFVTYLGNLYSVFTWCRPEILLPWMIVSALKNFLLELILLIITSLLYLEGNFPSILFAEFIIESLITFAPAVYYWCGIKNLFVELSHFKRRKLTRTNLIVDSDNNGTYFDNNFVDNYNIKRKKFMSLINFDDLSFNSSFEFEGEHEQYRQTKSLTTLTTMDSRVSVEPEELLTLPIIEDTSLPPAEKAMKILGLTQDDVNQTRVRLGKSISTNKSKLQQMEDRSTKNETTALLILGQNEYNRNEVILSQEKSKPGDEGQSSHTFQKIIAMSSTQSPSNDPSNDGKAPKRCTCQMTNAVTANVKIPEDIGNPMTKIPEDESEDHEDNDDDFHANEDSRRSASSVNEPSKKNINDKLISFDPSIFWSDDFPQSDRYKNGNSKERVSNELKNVGPSVFWSVDFPRSNLYKVPDLSDRSYDEDVENSETHSSSSQLNRSFPTAVNEDIDEEDVNFSDSTSGNGNKLNVELSKSNDISLELQNQIDDNAKFLGIDITYGSLKEIPHQWSLSKIENYLSMQSHKVRENVGNVTSFPNTLDVEIQTDFEDNSDKSITDVAKAEFFPNISRVSTSTQTNISDFWKKASTNSKRPTESFLDQHPSKTITFSEPNPENLPTNLIKMLPSRITRFTRIKRRPENIKEREAREMKALRAYNRLTLLEDKREMDLKKRNPAFNNRTGLQKLLSSPNWMNPATSNMHEVSKAESNQRPEKQMVRADNHQLPKRQTRSRPQEKTSKLSTFNQGLEALENSISLSFSSDNKKRSKLHQVNKPNQIFLNTQYDGRKQLSKYSKPMRNIDKVSLPSNARTEGLQTGRDLDRTRGTENMIHRNRSQKFDDNFSSFDQNRLQDVFSGTVLSSLDSLQTQRQNSLEIVEFHDQVQLQDKYGLARLKEAIKNTDWGFNGHIVHENDIVQHENDVTSHENVLYDIIDNTDFTISLLQNAFALNPGNTERGFHLGLGSTELYSVSHYLDDVVKEIMKTARFRPNPDTFPAESTTEVDYGLSYLQEFEEVPAVTKITTSSTAKNSDDETDSNLDTENNDDTGMEELESMINIQIIPAKPVEMCWNSSSREEIDSWVHSIIATNLANEETKEDQFDSDNYQDQLKLQNSNGGKSIGELLSKQEISSVEYWAKELKDLASNDRRNDFGFTKEFQHLTRLPGFCVIKMLVDFFRDFVAVSRSTMTSRMFLGTGTSSTPGSLDSEEFISGHYNELSNTSTGNDLATITSNFGNQANERDVFDALHGLIDQLIDSTEGNNPPNNPVCEVHDNQPIFPLREDQFYFGTPGNTYRSIKEDPTSKLEAEVIPDTLKKQSHVDGDGGETVPQEIDAQHRISITFYILGTAQSPIEVHEQEVTLPGNSGGPFRPDSTDDSFDSLYSASYVKNSKTSNNVASIGAEDSFEEFPKDPN